MAIGQHTAARPGKASAADTPPGRRERNKLEKRERIKAAARALFASKGFTATTTQEIAERADIGTGTLFLYVQSKEEVLVLVFRDEMDRVCEQAFASIPERASLLDAFVHVFGALVAFHDRDQELARVFVKEVLFVKEQHRRGIYDFVDALIARCADLVEQAKKRGEVAADVPAQLLAENCFAAYLVRLQKWLGLREPLATTEHVARLRDSFALQVRGLGPDRTTTSARARSRIRRRAATRT